MAADGPTHGEQALAEAIATSDVLRRVAGTTAIHIYEMRYAADGSYVCTAFIGAGLESLLGSLPEGVDEEEAWEAAVHPDDQAAYAEFGRTCQRGEPAEVEFRLVGYDGVTRWVWERARPRIEAGVVYVDGIVADVSERRRAAEELARAQARVEHLAYHDPLTDLPNRLLFQEHLDVALRSADRSGGAVAVLFADLNDFKLVNDSHGHAAGDQVLCEVAERLRGAVRASDVVARLGGDEFLILIRDAGPDAGEIRRSADTVIGEVRSALTAPIRLRNADVETELAVSASIGVSVYPSEATDAEAMLRDADIAMYQAKLAARDGRQPAGQSRKGSARLSMLARLRTALDRDEMVLHYQPLVDLEDGSLVGAEALIRWQDPQRGLVPPSDFLPLAERAGLMVPLSEWVLDQACRQAAGWRREGLDLYVSVNMPPPMWRPTAMRHLMGTLESFGLTPDRLMVELTESAVAADGHIEPVLAELHHRGLRLAIDDFGTGHSSLSRLSQLSVTTLKIDRSFITGLPSDHGAAILVTAIVQLALNLGLQPLAEGVETEEQRAFLLNHGCPWGQGFLFSPAVPAHDIPGLYSTRNRRAA